MTTVASVVNFVRPISHRRQFVTLNVPFLYNKTSVTQRVARVRLRQLKPVKVLYISQTPLLRFAVDLLHNIPLTGCIDESMRLAPLKL